MPDRKRDLLYRFDIETTPVTDLSDEAFLFTPDVSQMPRAVEYSIPLGFGTSLEAISLEEIEPVGLALLGNIGEG